MMVLRKVNLVWLTILPQHDCRDYQVAALRAVGERRENSNFLM